MTFLPRGLTPLLSVFDMPASLRFYCDLLGFTVTFASPEIESREGRFSHFVSLRLGPVDLMLNTQYDSNERPDHFDAARVAAHGDTIIYLGCDDVEAAYSTLAARGLKSSPPERAPYGLLLFSAKDPDGYSIVFQEAR